MYGLIINNEIIYVNKIECYFCIKKEYVNNWIELYWIVMLFILNY